MKILLLTQFLTTTRGGGEYVFWLIAKMLAANNHQVTVITSKTENIEYHLPNVKIVFVPPTLKQDKTIPTFIDNLKYCINSTITALQIIKKENIIHSNNFAPAFAGSVLSTLTGKPHIITVHDVFSQDKSFLKQWRAQGASRINTLLTPLFEKLVTRLRHDCIHTVSQTSKEDTILLGERKPIYVIHNSVEVSKIEKGIKYGQIVYVGRLLFYKNLEVVVKAINLIKDIEPKIKLVIIGSGPHKESLENLVKALELQKHVEFRGYLEEVEKTGIIAESQALVFPSLYEGFGLVVLEAFAQTKPVLGSNVRPISDIVEHGITGYVLDPHDEKSWADHILKIIRNQDKTIQMGYAARHVLESNYSPKSMHMALLRMYQSLNS